MPEYLVVLKRGLSSPADARRDLPQVGGEVLHDYGPRVLVLKGRSGLEGPLALCSGVERVAEGPIAEVPEDLSEGERLGIGAWNARHLPAFSGAKRRRKGEGRSWGDTPLAPKG